MDGGYGGRAEAQRLLEIANKLLVARDFLGSKRFAERALDSDPLVEGVDQILAVVDVLLASQRRVNSQQPDWYSILQLPHPSSSSSSSSSSSVSGDIGLDIKRSYRHLALLLSPNCNKFLYADAALRVVFEAYTFLSDPAKKSLFDAELRGNCHSQGEAWTRDRLFWTSCPACCHVFEYERTYIDRSLRCQICAQPFVASELASAPPIVPGADMYYCSWGFFPLGFPGSGFSNPGTVGMNGWKPFLPVSQWCGNQGEGSKATPLNAVPVNIAVGNLNADVGNGGKTGSSMKPGNRSISTRNKKVVAKKRVGNYEKKIALFGETDSENEVLDTGGVGNTVAGTSDGDAIANFDIDLEATEDLLSNLHDLPFV